MREIAAIVLRSLQTNQYEPNKKLMNFIRAGKKVKILKRKKMSVLSSASDWQMKVNIGRQLKFPWQTQLGLDMIIYLDKTIQVLILELM